MKRVMILVLITILFLSFVVAQNDLTSSDYNTDDEINDDLTNSNKENEDNSKNKTYDDEDELEVEIEVENEDEDDELEDKVQLRENFCGTSTFAACEEDEDCIVGGCSQAVCQGATEEPAITTCEFKECYNTTKYDAECKCEDRKCRWDRITENEIKNITREKNRVRFNATKNECPKNCTCTGSAMKCLLEDGTREMTVTAGSSGNVIIQIKGINATTNVTLYKAEDGKLYSVNENNETREIKFLPDEIRERVKERVSRELESEEIELNDDGTYEYQAEKRARLFALFPVKVRVEAEINSETGEVKKIKTSWWGFLALDEEQTNEDLSGGTMLAGSESNLTDEELAAA